LPGVTNGPYISQFLYYDIKYGALSTVLQKYNVASSGSGSDFMNTAALTLQVQNGTPDTSHTVGTTSRYVATPRDLASIVHSDAAAQFEHLACIILSNALSANGLPGFNNFKVPFNPLLLKGMPSSQTCFIECSVCDSLALIDKAAQLALEASWYIKWKAFLLRPEYYGLLLDEFLNDKLKLAGVFQSDVLDSKALTAIKALNPGVYAGLPQCYPEGCPGMPSWPEGHSCVAAAGATILKAFFDGTTTLPVVVEPNPSTTYTTLRVVPSVTTTVNAELNKLVSNVGIGRCIAGVHWRSDSYDAIILGEQVALRLLKDHIKTIPFVSGYRIEKFDGTTIEITNQKGSD
jgi:hypothetical protein